MRSMSVTIAPTGGPAAVAPQPAARESEPRFLNRELSALDFQERVLALAEDPTVPILERVKFVAIAAGHLDDLYGVRMSALRAQAASRGPARSPDGLTAAEQLGAITRRAEDLATRHAAVFAGPIRRALSRAIQIERPGSPSTIVCSSRGVSPGRQRRARWTTR